MKREKEKNKSLISATVGLTVSSLVLLFTLIFGATVVFGWTLSGKNGANIGEIGTGIVADREIADYTVFSYNIETGDVIGGAASADMVLSDIRFQAYDRTFTAHNYYTPVFVRVSFPADGIPENGKIIFRINRNLSPVDPESGNALKDDSGADFLSGRSSIVMRFTMGINKTFAETAEAFPSDARTDALYNAVNSFYYGKAENGLVGETFAKKVSINGNTVYEKSDFIITECAYDASFWNETVSGERVLHVYLYISYDTELVENYVFQRMAAGDVFGEDAIINDLSEIVVIYTE